MAVKPARITGVEEFEPKNFLTRVSGAEYLEVKWRLVWLRKEHPNAVIETECLLQTENTFFFKATISIPDGGSSTGHGQECTSDFKDAYEKAETKAIGRALAALGFGTQFAPDIDDGSAQNRPVDAPVKTDLAKNSGATFVNTAVRAELLTQGELEKRRVGAELCREWAETHTTHENPKLSSLSDEELRQLLEFTKTQPDRASVAA